MKPLALLGGTFDPVHVGHLRAAIEAQEALAAEEVWLLPSAVPPHRDQPIATPAQRLQMLEAAIVGLPGLRADARELRRSGPSYTYDTLISVRAEIGDARPLVLIVGADAFATLPGWHRWRELADLAHIAVLARPDAHGLIDPRLEELLAGRGTADSRQLSRRPAGLVLRLQIPPLPVSSTLIRTRMQDGRSVRFLVPDPVLEMLDAEGWYGARGRLERRR